MFLQNEGVSPESRTEAVVETTVTAVGVCMGASTVSMAEVGKPKEGGPPRLLRHAVRPHEGNPKETLETVLAELGGTMQGRLAVTGRRFRTFVNLTTIPESEAVELAYRFVKPEGVDCPAVVSAGGETFMVYVLNQSGRISRVLTGNKCASGTGEFFLQQLRRMNVTLETAGRWAATETPHNVSGRCSVFCKSDCTHATNKGIPKSRVTAGLCKMMAGKILELLKRVEKRNILLTGGTARNRMMVEYLRKGIDNLIVPDQAPYFEALGAALWALENETRPLPDPSRLFRTEAASFGTLRPLVEFEDRVSFKTMEMGTVQANDVCILGLDVGSTTTKAVLLRKSDAAILASVYLRTNGDPVGASRQCYQSIREQMEARTDPSSVPVIGLGVCGSGRQIAGLHAMTDGVINEIIAHAAAAVHFDPEVDTIFEIGGQDAKYTYITGGVASDYAMNEACSAGTGSFLEESALETLNIPMTQIADIALAGKRPPNFNDQCAAFISSDIKNAVHEGIGRADIVAGLVYSICMNYTHRVKGSRPVGEKVFMQGGVCYNRAVPLAMAALMDKPIVVPPEPGLMGAFGVALEVGKRLDMNLMTPAAFDLQELARRTVEYGKSFVCGGGPEKCDRRCTISMVDIGGNKYPFGGACNRYDNLRRNVTYDVASLDRVRKRQKMVFGEYGQESPPPNVAGRGRIAFNRSLLVNTYYPFYSTFFTRLGFTPTLPEVPAQEGIDRRNAAFCYPVELTHGFFHTLLHQDPPPSFIFLPHFKSVPMEPGHKNAEVCPLLQGEPFYLKSAFRDRLTELEEHGTKVLTPLIEFKSGLENARKPLVETAVRQMKASRQAAETAFDAAVKRQNEFENALKRMGRSFLKWLEQNPDRVGVVLFGRAYNAFAKDSHMGIPHKFASRGISIIPFDCLPFEAEETKKNMYWGLGQRIMKGARFVERHPRLFGTYITNFSCGPDSFLISYFRSVMGQKPTLTLELDSHTADAGLETRIEAFLDVLYAYRKLVSAKRIFGVKTPYTPARTEQAGEYAAVVTSRGERLSLTDSRVSLLFPSMGRIFTEATAAVFRGTGINAVNLPEYDESIIKLGRANTTGKECLPLTLTTGALLNYVTRQKQDGEVVVYFMPTTSGPCRFGQYYVSMEDLLRRHRIPDVAMLTPSSEDAYAGLGGAFQKIAWWGSVTADVFEDIRSMVLANAEDPKAGIADYYAAWQIVLDALATADYPTLIKALGAAADRLSGIPMKRPPEEVPTIALIGEIFVRRDSVSRNYLTERLAASGIATLCAPVAEWILYTQYLVDHGLTAGRMTFKENLAFQIRKLYMRKYESQIKSILSKTGLVHAAPIRVKKLVEAGKPYVSPNLTGETLLTVGSAIAEIVTEACGIISIGPFGCMPSRLAEAVLVESMTASAKLAAGPGNRKLRQVLEGLEDLPFLSIEVDGSPFPQLIEAKLEAFCLNARRLHERMHGAA